MNTLPAVKYSFSTSANTLLSQNDRKSMTEHTIKKIEYTVKYDFKKNDKHYQSTNISTVEM